MNTPYTNSIKRFKEYFDDILSEISDGYDPKEVADAITECLEGWIKYHTDCLATYEAVRARLRE
jgi:hypothetical protein